MVATIFMVYILSKNLRNANLFHVFDMLRQGRSEFAGRSGAQRSEESANREGVAAGGATNPTPP